ncbi:GH24770 [Drosophila grimshawi]|uniref:GH24770 n=2 Tax=Drosophila grimshawi TaxID=7222 RepID=B4JN84_DROGR|nr:GH24770 [Drosophila grimshawi]
MHTISSKSLSNEEIAEVHKWLQQNEFNASRIRREFSDVLPLAEMMKRDYPRLVDLNNFPKRSSVQRKVANWEAFNYKVLSKFNLQMNPEFILLLATGAHGAAEVLLSEIMRVKKRQRVVESRNAILAQEQIWEENDEVKTVIVNKQVGDGIVQVPQKMILYSLYENMARDNQAKDLIIETNRKRLAHMENIIKVKTERIDELLIQVGKSPTNKPQVSPRSSFTSRLASTSLLSYEALGCTRKRHPNTPVSSD